LGERFVFIPVVYKTRQIRATADRCRRSTFVAAPPYRLFISLIVRCCASASSGTGRHGWDAAMRAPGSSRAGYKLDMKVRLSGA